MLTSCSPPTLLVTTRAPMHVFWAITGSMRRLNTCSFYCVLSPVTLVIKQIVSSGLSRFGAQTSSLAANPKGGGEEVGMARERGLRIAAGLLGTPLYIDPTPNKVDGVLPKELPSFCLNSAILAAFRQFIRFSTPHTDAEVLSECQRMHRVWIYSRGYSTMLAG